MRKATGVVIAWICGIAAIAGSVALLAATDADAGREPTGKRHAALAPGGGAKVLCWNRNFPPPNGSGGPQVQRTPERCTFFERGEDSLSGAVQAFDLKWKKWGSSSARGNGKVQAAMGNTSRLRVKLTEPKSGCRGRVYSKAKLETAAFGNKTKMRLWTRCG